MATVAAFRLLSIGRIGGEGAAPPLCCVRSGEKHGGAFTFRARKTDEIVFWKIVGLHRFVASRFVIDFHTLVSQHAVIFALEIAAANSPEWAYPLYYVLIF